MRPAFLKVGATLFTIVATGLSAVFVTSHLKNAAAPLRPSVLSAGNATAVSAPGGTLILGPSVQPSDLKPVTSTYAS